MSSLLTVETWNEFLWKKNCQEKKNIFNKIKFFTRTIQLFATDLTDNWNNIELRVILFLLLRSSIFLSFIRLRLTLSRSAILAHLLGESRMHQHTRGNDDDRASTNTDERSAMNQFAYDSNGMHHHYFYVRKKAPLVIGTNFSGYNEWFTTFEGTFIWQFTPLEEGFFCCRFVQLLTRDWLMWKFSPTTLRDAAGDVVVAASEWKN